MANVGSYSVNTSASPGQQYAGYSAPSLTGGSTNPSLLGNTPTVTASTPTVDHLALNKAARKAYQTKKLNKETAKTERRLKALARAKLGPQSLLPSIR